MSEQERREAMVREAVGAPWEIVSDGFACGRAGKSWRMFRVTGPKGEADVLIGRGAATGEFSVTVRTPG